MTHRSEFGHRKLELREAAMAKAAGLALSRKATGLDRIAKNALAKRLGNLPHDPELDHPDHGSPSSLPPTEPV